MCCWRALSLPLRHVAHFESTRPAVNFYFFYLLFFCAPGMYGVRVAGKCQVVRVSFRPACLLPIQFKAGSLVNFATIRETIRGIYDYFNVIVSCGTCRRVFLFNSIRLSELQKALSERRVRATGQCGVVRVSLLACLVLPVHSLRPVLALTWPPPAKHGQGRKGGRKFLFHEGDP
jgi:hypothetical protein